MEISVKVKPNAKQEQLRKVDADNYLVWVKEKPQEGRANQAVIKVLAEYFGVAKSEVILIKGQNSRQKVFAVEGYKGNS